MQCSVDDYDFSCAAERVQKLILQACSGVVSHVFTKNAGIRRSLAEIEERLDDMTVNELLEKYPVLAQEIKDEIEAGNFDRTNAGFKVGSVTTA
jgi:hypothetical protein